MRRVNARINHCHGYPFALRNRDACSIREK